MSWFLISQKLRLLRMKVNKRIILFIIPIILFLSLLVFRSHIAYIPQRSILDKGEYGLSEYSKGVSEWLKSPVQRSVISSFSATQKAINQTIVIDGGNRQFTPSEVRSYVEFVEKGGGLIVFEDFGPARAIVNAFGISYLPGVIRETNPALYTNSPDKPIIFEQVFSRILKGYSINPLQLNRANAVIDLEGFSRGTTFPILLSNSSTTYLDINDDNKIQSSEPVGRPLPLGLLKIVKKGFFVVIADSTFPLNFNWNRKISISNQSFIPGNGAYSLVLTAYMMALTHSKLLIFDESHLSIDPTSFTGFTSWIVGALIGIIYSPELIFLISLLVIIIITNQIRFIFKKKTQEPSSRVSFISKPTRSEKTLSEVFLLEKVMKVGILPTVCIYFYEQIKSIEGNAEIDRRIFEELNKSIYDLETEKEFWQLNELLRNYVSENKKKWV